MNVAVIKTKAESGFLDQFQQVLPSLPGGADVASVRRGAIAAFTELGMPHRRIEAWKYTDLRTLLKEPQPEPSVGQPASVSRPALIEALGAFAAVDATRLVFVDGHFAADLSDGSTDGVTLTPLSAKFTNLASNTTDAIGALNTAFATDGAIVEVLADIKVAKPIFIVCVASGPTSKTATLRHEITVGVNARLDLVELYVTLPGAAAGQHVNAATDVSVADGAHVAHVKATVGSQSVHLSHMTLSLGHASVYRGFQFVAGQALVRNQATVTFGAPKGDFDLSGAFLGRGSDHIDTALTVDHAVPGCQSRELFTGVLDDRARGIFQGKVIVRPQAQQTDGKQMAKVMMLSPDAEFDSKPELEIYADDVVCGHGSTVAEIDEDLLFYCQARGIPRTQARALLVQSFVGEAIDKVANEEIRDALGSLANTWLAGDTVSAHHGS